MVAFVPRGRFDLGKSGLLPERGERPPIEYLHQAFLKVGYSNAFPVSIEVGRQQMSYGIHPQFSNALGSELDFMANDAVGPYLNFQAGYSHFFVGKYLKQSVASVTANGGTSDADYASVQVKFNF